MSSIAIDIPKEQLRDFCRKWKITEFALFGSVTRPEEFREDSDVDVLVTFAEDADWSVFDHFQAEDELSVIVGRRVEMATRRAIEESPNRFVRGSIFGSAVSLEL